MNPIKILMFLVLTATFSTSQAQSKSEIFKSLDSLLQNAVNKKFSGGEILEQSISETSMKRVSKVFDKHSDTGTKIYWPDFLFKFRPDSKEQDMGVVTLNFYRKYEKTSMNGEEIDYIDKEEDFDFSIRKSDGVKFKKLLVALQEVYKEK